MVLKKDGDTGRTLKKNLTRRQQQQPATLSYKLAMSCLLVDTRCSDCAWKLLVYKTGIQGALYSVMIGLETWL